MEKKMEHEMGVRFRGYRTGSVVINVPHRGIYKDHCALDGECCGSWEGFWEPKFLKTRTL